jgi:hypothetical protein
MRMLLADTHTIFVGVIARAFSQRRRFRFETLDAFNSFVNSGWAFGANAMAAAKTKTEGGALAGAVTVAKGRGASAACSATGTTTSHSNNDEKMARNECSV